MRHRPASCLIAALLVLATAGCGGALGEDLPALSASTPPSIRVLLRPRTPRLGLHGQSWVIRSEEGARFERRGRAPFSATVRLVGRGIVMGTEATGSQRLRVRAERGFEVNNTRYAGDLLLSVHDGKLRFVNEVDLETYIAGVVPNEMGPGAPPAAYRAQAVAARTYAWHRIGSREGGDERSFHLYDTQASQVYTGMSPRYEIPYEDMLRRTRETRGVILTWKNRPFPAYYSSTCGGHTTDATTSLLDAEGATEPLRGVRCGFCTTSSRFSWQKKVSAQDVVAGLERRRRPITLPVHRVAVEERGTGGWIRRVAVTYGPNRKVRKVPGTEFRSALKLDSHNIQRIRPIQGGWLIEGRGWGHGVGMCQWGAREMSDRGLSESDILRWYYPGAAFAKIY